METEFEFYPNRINKYILPFAVIMLLVYLVILCLSFNPFVLILALMNAWLIVFLYATLHTNILFTQNGFHVYESKRKEAHNFTWKQIRYGYYTKNFKGHKFLLLAPNKLTEKELRQYTNKGANTNRVCFGTIVVFPIENLQYTSELERFIFSKVIFVD